MFFSDDFFKLRSEVLAARAALAQTENLCPVLKADYFARQRELPVNHEKIAAAWNLFHTAELAMKAEKEVFDELFEKFSAALSKERKEQIK